MASTFGRRVSGDSCKCGAGSHKGPKGAGTGQAKKINAEFASPAVAAAALEQCRGKKIGDSSCKFDVCQKLPNFSNKPAKRERRPPRAAAPAPAEASAASESKREA